MVDLVGALIDGWYVDVPCPVVRVLDVDAVSERLGIERSGVRACDIEGGVGDEGLEWMGTSEFEEAEACNRPWGAGRSADTR